MWSSLPVPTPSPRALAHEEKMLGEDVDVEAMEELQLDYEERCSEVAELRAELRVAHIEAQKLRLRLQAAGARNTSLVPAELRPGPGASGDGRAGDLGGLLKWLAEHVDVTAASAGWGGGLPRAAMLGISCNIALGGRPVNLDRVVQWRLDLPGDLRLSVPAALETEIAGLLLAARAACGGGEEEQRRFEAAARQATDAWEVVATELGRPDALGESQPAVLLAHRDTSEGLLVATWPSVKAYKVREECIQLRGAVASLGDRVEVYYEGEWFLGVVQKIEGDMASVQCDADPPGLMTLAPLVTLRRIEACTAARDFGPACAAPLPIGCDSQIGSAT